MVLVPSGVYGRRFCISAAHTEEDIWYWVEQVKDALRVMKETQCF